LYTSDTLLNEFPGRSFRILSKEVKTELKNFAENEKINVITRNYSSDAAQLKKKYKIKDGGKYYLLGFKDLNSKPQLMIADRL